MSNRAACAVAWTLVVAASAATAPTSAQAVGESVCRGAKDVPTAATLDVAAGATVCLVNAEREARGRRPVRESPALERAAVRHSRHMVQRKFFAHVTPRGEGLGDRVRQAGYVRRGETWLLGENLAWGTGALSTPAEIVDGWMQSRPHRLNVLDARWRHAGVGVVAGTPARGERRTGATYTLDLGSRNRAAR